MVSEWKWVRIIQFISTLHCKLTSFSTVGKHYLVLRVTQQTSMNKCRSHLTLIRFSHAKTKKMKLLFMRCFSGWYLYMNSLTDCSFEKIFAFFKWSKKYFKLIVNILLSFKKTVQKCSKEQKWQNILSYLVGLYKMEFLWKRMESF